MRPFCAIAFLVLLAFGQSGQSPSLGGPLPGISAAEAELFRMGLEDFKEVETAADGLGPAFNGTSCAACHSVPTVGGITAMTEIRAGHRDADGNFHKLQGGTLFHLFSTPPHRCQVQIPPEANVIARRAPIPVFGAGLVEAIDDQSILALEDPEDRDGDGISGRAAIVTDIASGQSRVGRFGWKSQHATLLAFSADAYRNEMGITNELIPDELALGIDPEQLKLCAPVRKGIEDIRDRRTLLRGIDQFENFMRLLAPPARAEASEDSRAGEQLFASIGCARCHTPSLTTGRRQNPVFDRKSVPLFSDLLLHDVGTGDGIVQDAAAANELRTPALWGLRFRRPLMHDGASPSLDHAILRHAAEAESTTENYRKLDTADRARLLAFLNSL